MEIICNRPFSVELPDESAILEPNFKGNFYYKEYQQ